MDGYTGLSLFADVGPIELDPAIRDKSTTALFTSLNKQVLTAEGDVTVNGVSYDLHNVASVEIVHTTQNICRVHL